MGIELVFIKLFEKNACIIMFLCVYFESTNALHRVEVSKICFIKPDNEITNINTKQE